MSRSLSILAACFSLFLAACGAEDQPVVDVNPSAAAPEAVSSQQSAKFGEEVSAPGVTLTVDSVTESETLVLYADGVKRGTKPDESFPARDGGKFITIATTLKNTGKKPWDLTCGFAIQVQLKNAEGQLYESEDDLYRVPGNPECSDTLNPGFSTTMTWPFEMPFEAEAIEFGFADPKTNYDQLTFIDIVGAPDQKIPATELSASEDTSSEAAVTLPDQSTPSAPIGLNEFPASDPRPAFVECLRDGGGNYSGKAEFTDGSFEWHPECEVLRTNQLESRPYRCPQTDFYVADPIQCSAQNTPPPASRVSTQEKPVFDSSGEAQAYYGCKDGIIDDQELCATMFSKYSY